MKSVKYKSLFVLFAILILIGCSKADKVQVQSIEDLGNEGVRISIGDPKHVPAGRYAEDVIKNLSKENPELAGKIESNIVSKKVNVRAVLDKVAMKEKWMRDLFTAQMPTQKKKR